MHGSLEVFMGKTSDLFSHGSFGFGTKHFRLRLFSLEVRGKGQMEQERLGRAWVGG